MTDNMQEELSEKPTKTELKKIREYMILSTLALFWQDNVSLPFKMKVPEDFSNKLGEFIASVDAPIWQSVILDTINKQIKKVNKML